MIIERIQFLSPYFKSAAKIKSEAKNTFGSDAVVFEQEKNGGQQNRDAYQNQQAAEENSEEKKPSSESETGKSPGLNVLA